MIAAARLSTRISPEPPRMKVLARRVRSGRHGEELSRCSHAHGRCLRHRSPSRYDYGDVTVTPSESTKTFPSTATSATMNVCPTDTPLMLTPSSAAFTTFAATV